MLRVKPKKFLTNRQVQIRVHKHHRAVSAIANTIYVDEEYNKIAIELAKGTFSGFIYRERTNIAVGSST